MLCISVYSRRVRVYTALSIQNQPPLKIISKKTTCPYIVFSSFCLILFDELRFCMTQKRMFFSGRIYNLLPGSWPPVHCGGGQNHRHGDSVCVQQLQGQGWKSKKMKYVLFSWAWNSNNFKIYAKLRYCSNYPLLCTENSCFYSIYRCLIFYSLCQTLKIEIQETGFERSERLHFKRPQPITAPFWASKAPECWL